MSNPIVRFGIHGHDLEGLRRFYREALGWETFLVAKGVAVVETYPHDHDPATGADISRPVVIEESEVGTRWRYAGERHAPRLFTPGIPEGGLGRGEPQVIIYAEVEDIDATLDRVEAAGGKITLAPTAIAGYTTIATFLDIEGNEIGLQLPFPD